MKILCYEHFPISLKTLEMFSNYCMILHCGCALKFNYKSIFIKKKFEWFTVFFANLGKNVMFILLSFSAFLKILKRVLEGK